MTAACCRASSTRRSQALLAAAPLLALLLAAARARAAGDRRLDLQQPRHWCPNFTRLNPVAGLGRMFSVRGLIELGKAWRVSLVVALVAASCCCKQFRSFSGLGNEPVQAAIAHALTLVGTALHRARRARSASSQWSTCRWRCGSTTVAAHDPPGDARGAQGDRGQPGDQITRAPRAAGSGAQTHDAGGAEGGRRGHQPDALRGGAALRRAAHARAGRGGEGRGADRAHASARSRSSTRCRSSRRRRWRARCTRSCELGDEIPARLYAAVAKVLTYVYQLRAARRGGGRTPPPPHIEMPEE